MRNILTILTFWLVIASNTIHADEGQNDPTRIHHLAPGSILYLSLEKVSKEIFNHENKAKGFTEIILVERNKKYEPNKHETKLVEHILNKVPPEEHGNEKYLVGPISAHASERYLVEFKGEVLFITPYWEDLWKKYEKLPGPLIDIQRCKKAGETRLNGVEYDVYETSGLYHQGVDVPRALADQVNWFTYKASDLDTNAK